MYGSVLVIVSIDECLCCLCVLTIINKVAVNMGVQQISFQDIDLISFGYTSKRDIAGSHGNFAFYFLPFIFEEPAYCFSFFWRLHYKKVRA